MAGHGHHHIFHGHEHKKEEGPQDHHKEMKHHKRLAEAGVVAAGAYAVPEKNKANVCKYEYLCSHIKEEKHQAHHHGHGHHGGHHYHH